jgi:hypothetical protein
MRPAKAGRFFAVCQLRKVLKTLREKGDARRHRPQTPRQRRGASVRLSWSAGGLGKNRRKGRVEIRGCGTGREMGKWGR